MLADPKTCENGSPEPSDLAIKLCRTGLETGPGIEFAKRSLSIQLLQSTRLETGANLSFIDFPEHGMVSSLAGEIERHRTNRLNIGPIVEVQPEGSKTPLLFIPGHDGVLPGIRQLARLLKSDQPVHALEAPQPESFEGCGSKYSFSEIRRSPVNLLKNKDNDIPWFAHYRNPGEQQLLGAATFRPHPHSFFRIRFAGVKFHNSGLLADLQSKI